MRAVRAIRAITCLVAVAAVSAFAAPPAIAADAPVAQPFAEVEPGVKTKSVTVAEVTSGTPYVSFTVPDCVAEIAYVIDGGEGGSSRRVGTNAFAPGGAGAVRSGTILVSPGEQLRLYPAAKGGSAQLNSDYGDAGGGGAIGFRAGGGGTGKDQDYALPWNIHQNAGGGGGASSAITLNTVPLVVAAGGGGAGGSSWNDAKNTAVGGAGDVRGADGVSNAGSGGALGAGAAGTGLRGNDPSGNGGGAGGGGGGYLGGGGGRASGTGGQGGGAGAGGTSYTDATRVGSRSIAEFGLASSDVTPTADGVVKIAWVGCRSILSIEGTVTDVEGAPSPAAGWEHRITVGGRLIDPITSVLDDSGWSDAFLSGYLSIDDTFTVTVKQETRPGWILRDWDDTAMHQPFATCVDYFDPDIDIPVTNVDAHSFRLTTEPGQWIVCTVDTVEGAPDMTVSASATHAGSGLPTGNSVTAGDDVHFAYTVRNTGNLPLDLTISDPQNDAMACAQAALLPGDQTLCSGTTTVTRD